MGIVGASVYYTNEYGVWGDADSSTKVIGEVRNLYHHHVSPYFKDVKTNVPLEVSMNDRQLIEK